jgi:hypothetical protein
LRLKVANAAEADRNASHLALCNCDLSWLPFANRIAEFLHQASIQKKERMLEAVRLKGGGIRPGDGN